MTDYEFAKKPRRMTDPPQNKQQTFMGYEGVQVIMETDPVRIAYFTREATWGDVMREPTEEELYDTLAEVVAGKVLGAAKEVPALGFRVVASRSTMDQLLRLREAAAGAQTTRDNDQRDFNIVIPNTIAQLSTNREHVELVLRVQQLVDDQRAVYGALVDAGVPPQDARYVALPLGFSTQWVHVMNLRALEKMCEQRLCNGLTQHESNFVVRVMRDKVVEQFPWTDLMLRSSCEKRGQCASRTMLFPPCGAFDKDGSGIALQITKYDPDKHLYPADANDGMEFAMWDANRVKLEKQNPNAIYSMAEYPLQIGERA